MKKWLCFLLLLSLLSGCGMVDDSYYVVQKHSEPPTQATQNQNETEEPTVVTDRDSLRAALLYRTRNWIEQDTLLIENYVGDFNQDLSEVLNHATQEDPIGAYAVDYIDVQLVGSAVSGSIQVAIVFRRSAAEINSIVTVNSTANALQRIQLAMISYETSLTLRIRNYREVDFTENIRTYCLENPNKVVAIPEFSAEVYPKSGETRILELHFTYPNTRDELRRMLATVNTVLTSANSYIKSAESDLERLALLTRFLTTRFDYRITENAPVMPAYELLHDGLAHSLSFATVFRYECAAAGIDCQIISGTLNDSTHNWNLVQIDGVYYYVDLMNNICNGIDELTLLSSDQLRDLGYVWDDPETDESPSEPESSEEVTATEPTEAETEPSEAEAPMEEPTEPQEND